MQFIFAIILCFLIGFIFWFIGHIVRKELKVTEEQKLLGLLINICLGASFYLMLCNLIASIAKSFVIGNIAFFIVTVGIFVWQFSELKSSIFYLIELVKNNKFYNLIKENTNKYFWILFGSINFIYITVAFSTTKLNNTGTGNTHTYNIGQIVNDIYPPKYPSFPSLDLRDSYGADIFGALLSQLTGLNFELSLDLLKIFFLNLCLLAVFALALKFLDSNKISKYLIPFGAFIAWAPIAALFPANGPQKFLEKLSFISQNNLTDIANSSGLVLHWFFEPTKGFGIFFMLIGVYLIFKFFSGNEKNINYTILLGVFLSTLIIIDYSKLIVLSFGILLYLLFSYNPTGLINKFKNESEFLKQLGILFLIVLVLSIIHGNVLRIGKGYLPLIDVNKLGIGNLNEKIGFQKSNIVLLVIYGFGFFQAFKQKQSWTIFLLPFFLASIIFPFLFPIADSSNGGILMCANILGAFSLPFFVSFIENMFPFKKNELTAFYSSVFVILSISTLLFWAFGDKEKPLIAFENGSFKFTGLQKLEPVFSIDKQKYSDEVAILSYLKSVKAKNQTIIAEPIYNEVFAKGSRLLSLAPPSNIPENILSRDVLNEASNDYKQSFSFDSKAWVNKKINWLYLTPKAFRFFMVPQSRTIFLNAYLTKGVKLALSNSKFDDPERLKELYSANPKLLSSTLSNNFPDLLQKFINNTQENSKEVPYYIKEIASCPYFGIYSEKSNDFDGDMISDIAFFDNSKKSWYIVYGKDLHEDQIDLTSNLLKDLKGINLLVPIPSDYDGDKKTDIALYNKSNSIWYILRSSDSVTSTDKVWCSDWGEVPIPGDLDGDEKADYSCFNCNDGRWPSFTSTKNDYYSKTFSALPTDITVYSDIDGDKKSDYVIYKPALGGYEVHLSSCLAESSGRSCGGSTESGIVNVTIGTLTSRAVPQDYDGDGKTDLATWTPESGKWEISFAKSFIESKSGNTQKTVILGKTGDIPMPGDYNGDGKADIAIYHIDTSQLEVLFDNNTKKDIDLSKYKNLTPASFIGI